MSDHSALQAQRRGELPKWFLGGFLLVFAVMLIRADAYPTPYSGGLMIRPLWQYYVSEMKRAAGVSEFTDATNETRWFAATTFIKHLTYSGLAGVVMLAIGFGICRRELLDKFLLKTPTVMMASIIVVAWFAVAWITDDWRWSASLLYATLGAVVFAYLLSTCVAPPHRQTSLCFAISCLVPLVLNILTRPRGFLGSRILPADFSFQQCNLIDLVAIWCIGVSAAFAAYWSTKSQKDLEHQASL